MSTATLQEFLESGWSDTVKRSWDELDYHLGLAARVHELCNTFRLAGRALNAALKRFGLTPKKAEKLLALHQHAEQIKAKANEIAEEHNRVWLVPVWTKCLAWFVEKPAPAPKRETVAEVKQKHAAAFGTLMGEIGRLENRVAELEEENEVLRSGRKPDADAIVIEGSFREKPVSPITSQVTFDNSTRKNGGKPRSYRTHNSAPVSPKSRNAIVNRLFGDSILNELHDD